MIPSKIRVLEYIREDGSVPYKQWFDSLDPTAAAKVSVAKARLQLGTTSAIKWFKGIGEYVIDWGPGYRIYLANDGPEILILFGGSSKKGQREAIRTAMQLHQEYKARKKGLRRAEKPKGTKKKPG